MDYDVAEQNGAVYGDDGYLQEEYYYSQQQYHRGGDDGGGGGFGGGGGSGSGYNSVDDSSAGHGNELKRSNNDSSLAGKLFVGGIAWETTEESFSRYFNKYGEITDAILMMDKFTGRHRGFGFVTFADPDVANQVLQEAHLIDGRAVEVKRTVPKEEMQGKGVSKTKKIFVGGLPLSLTEDDLKEYFSFYGNIIESQIMLDHNSGRSRGFGFVTFENEDVVERIFSDGRMHELGGKRVEIKRAEPKRAGFDRGNESRLHRGSSSSKLYSGFGDEDAELGGGCGGKRGRGYSGFNGYGGYGGYGSYAGNYGAAVPGFYAGFTGYGYGLGFGGPMYGGAGYGGGNYGTPAGYGVPAGYGGGKGYGARGFGGSAGATGYGGTKSYGSGGGGGGGNKGYGDCGAVGGRFHPYWQ